jgi:8-oxo-dGTP diphosphatase
MPKEARAPNPEHRPALAVDAVVLSVEREALRVVLIERPVEPFAGTCCLPGGFVGHDEPLEQAARRVLKEKAGLVPDALEQLYTFGAPDRDPRGRVVSVAYLAVVRALPKLAKGAVALDLHVPWEGETGGPAYPVRGERRVATGFDHADILGLAVQRVRGKLSYTPLAFAFLPERFTLHQARTLHEVLLGRRLNKDSFRKSLQTTHDLVPTGERQSDVGHRPAELYRLGRRVVHPLS